MLLGGLHEVIIIILHFLMCVIFGFINELRGVSLFFFGYFLFTCSGPGFSETLSN